jgi:hypothetical protein
MGDHARGNHGARKRSIEVIRGRPFRKLGGLIMFVYTIYDIIGIAIIALILFVAIIFGIALLFARLINWIIDKRDKNE